MWLNVPHVAAPVTWSTLGVAPLATHRGLGVDYGQAATPRRAVGGVLLGVALSAAAVGLRAVPLLGVAVVTIAAIRWLSMRKIGGISGDVLGTCEQVAECLALVVLVGFAAHNIW